MTNQICWSQHNLFWSPVAENSSYFKLDSAFRMYDHLVPVQVTAWDQKLLKPLQWPGVAAQVQTHHHHPYKDLQRTPLSFHSHLRWCSAWRKQLSSRVHFFNASNSSIPSSGLLSSNSTTIIDHLPYLYHVWLIRCEATLHILFCPLLDNSRGKYMTPEE